MSRLFNKLLIAAAVSIGLSGTAWADILNFANTPNGNVTYSATSVSFVNPGSTGPVSGIFSGFGCTNCVTMTSFNSASTNFDVMTVMNGGNTLTVHLASVSFPPGPTLSVFGSGTESINGGASTPISFVLTSQGPAGSPVSYSGTITTVPLPGALALFGTGMVGFWGWSRKRRKAA
jgi:hypothetical protein